MLKFLDRYGLYIIFIGLFAVVAICSNLFDDAKFKLYKASHLDNQSKQWLDELYELQGYENVLLALYKKQSENFEAKNSFSRVISQKTDQIRLINILISSYKIEQKNLNFTVPKINSLEEAYALDKNLEELILIKYQYLIDNCKCSADKELLQKIQLRSISNYDLFSKYLKAINN